MTTLFRRATAILLAAVAMPLLADGVAMQVYKNPQCGCCGLWVEHVRRNGFTATEHAVADLGAIKSQHGVPASLRSCHTAVVEEGGYVFEGHVPAAVIRRFLAEQPADAIGLAVPGMPAGSPGMEMGDRFTPYSVMLLKKDGSASVYAKINGPEDQ